MHLFVIPTICWNPPVELPNTLGLTAPSENNCALRTTGWELQITWRDVTPFGLGYSISANISDARTKIKAYPGNITGDIANYNPGHYLGEIQGLTSIGIAKSQEEMDAHLAALDRRFEEVNGYAPATPLQGQSWYGTNWAAGDMMYKDVNGDGQITWGDWNWNNPGDMTVIGNTTPRYFFGIDLTANYKGFDFRAFFQGVGKRDFYSRSPLFGELSREAYGNQQALRFMKITSGLKTSFSTTQTTTAIQHNTCSPPTLILIIRDHSITSRIRNGRHAIFRTPLIFAARICNSATPCHSR